MSQEADLVGQADADEGTAAALGAVDQRRRGYVFPAGRTQAFDGGQGLNDEGLVERHFHPFPRASEVEKPVIALKPVLAQEQPLGADLDALRRPGPGRHMGPLALLVVHGLHPGFVTFYQIDLCRDAQRFGTEGHRAGMDRLRRAFGLGRKAPALLVHPLVPDRPLHRVGAVGKLPLHPHHVGQARAVDILVHHADGDEGSGLVVHGFRCVCTIVRPRAVRRYFCRRLVGFSGMVNSMAPALIARCW